MRAAAAASKQQQQPGIMLPAAETLAFISELRVQLQSQQAQLNELSRHTTGEINRLWAAVAAGGVGVYSPGGIGLYGGGRRAGAPTVTLAAGPGRSAVGALVRSELSDR